MDLKEIKRFTEECSRLFTKEKEYKNILLKRKELLEEIKKLDTLILEKERMYSRLFKMKDEEKIILSVKNANIVSNSNDFMVYYGSYYGNKDDFNSNNEIIDYNDSRVTYSVYMPLEVSYPEPVIIDKEYRLEYEKEHSIIIPANLGEQGYNEFKSKYFASVLKHGEEETINNTKMRLKNN